MLRKRIILDSTLTKLIESANKVEAKKIAGQFPFANLSAPRIRQLTAAMNDLEKKGPDEVLIFELVDPALRAARFAEWKARSTKRNDLAHLPVDVQIQKMTGAYYFHLINTIKRELVVAQGRRTLDEV